MMTTTTYPRTSDAKLNAIEAAGTQRITSDARAWKTAANSQDVLNLVADIRDLRSENFGLHSIIDSLEKKLSDAELRISELELSLKSYIENAAQLTARLVKLEAALTNIIQTDQRDLSLPNDREQELNWNDGLCAQIARAALSQN